MGRGIIDPDHPYAAPSPVHLEVVGELWDEADVVLAGRSDLDRMMTRTGRCRAARGPSVCVTGDGGFLFACGALATVVQERVPVTIVRVDDGGYGMLRYDQVSAREEPYSVDLAPDFVALAGAFDLPSRHVEGFGHAFREALRDGTGSAQPSMIVVRARLKPPPNTLPRWYRRRAAAPGH